MHASQLRTVQSIRAQPNLSPIVRAHLSARTNKQTCFKRRTALRLVEVRCRSSATLAAASGIVKDDSGCQQFGLQLSLCACGTGCSGERGNLSDRQPCFQRVRSRPDARTAKALAFICSLIIVRSCVQLGTRIRGQKLVLGQPDWQAGTSSFLLPQGDYAFLRYFAGYALWIMSVL